MGPQAQAVVTPAGATPGTQALQPFSRQQALARSQRVAINTPRLRGSIALSGGRIDDLSLVQYRETIDPRSAAIELLSPSGGPQAFYAEFGWVDASSVDLKVPTSNTAWLQEGSNGLGVGRPVVLVWQNGQGLEFRRTISVDANYLFTIRDEVANRGPAAVTLASYALISRHSPPAAPGTYLLHEGAIGVLGDQGLQEVTYKTLDDKKRVAFDTSNAWLGFTDKYWAALLVPETSSRLRAEFSASSLGTLKTYQADCVQDAQTVEPGGTASAAAGDSSNSNSYGTCHGKYLGTGFHNLKRNSCVCCSDSWAATGELLNLHVRQVDCLTAGWSWRRAPPKTARLERSK